MTPPADRLAEIAARAAAIRASITPERHPDDTTPASPLGSRSWNELMELTGYVNDLLAELARVTAERDKHKRTAEFLTDLVNEICEKVRAAP